MSLAVLDDGDIARPPSPLRGDRLPGASLRSAYEELSFTVEGKGNISLCRKRSYILLVGQSQECAILANTALDVAIL